MKYYEVKEKDSIRDLILQSKNLKVIRIKNSELVNIDAVLDKIAGEFN